MKAFGKTTLVMAAGAGVTAMMTEITTACPDILPKLPAIIAAGIMAAWALWMPSPRAVPPTQPIEAPPLVVPAETPTAANTEKNG